MKRIAFTLFLLCFSSPALADDTGKANELFVRAAQFIQSADQATSAEERLVLLEEALSNLHKIAENYPSTDMAVKLISGQEIGHISVAGVTEAVEDARWWACSASPDPECAIIDALEAVAEIKTRSSRGSALAFVASAQAAAGAIKGARESITQALYDTTTLDHAGDRAVLLVQIASAQAAVGDIHEARLSISAALAAPLFDYTDIRVVAFLASAQAAVGDFNGARNTISQALAGGAIGEDARVAGIAFIASTQVTLGDINGAKTSITQALTVLIKRY